MPIQPNQRHDAETRVAGRASEDWAGLKNPPGDEKLRMDLERDRAMIRRLMQSQGRRWQVSEKHKAAVVESLLRANDVAVDALSSDDPMGAVQAVSSIGRTVVMMEAQNQKDEHQEAEWARLDSGGVTERIGIDGLMAQSREEARRHAEDMARLLPGASPAAAVDPVDTDAESKAVR